MIRLQKILFIGFAGAVMSASAAMASPSTIVVANTTPDASTTVASTSEPTTPAATPAPVSPCGPSAATETRVEANAQAPAKPERHAERMRNRRTSEEKADEAKAWRYYHRYVD